MSEVKKLTILQMNDSHSYLETHPEFYWQGKQEIYRNAGGYARVASLFKQIRQENPDRVIALDNGDTIHGTYPAVSTKGQALVPILNKLAFDAMTAHWEFAYGADNFKEIAKKLAYPVLAINCYDKVSNKLVFPPYLLMEKGGLRIGIIGIAATIIDKTMPKHFSEGMYFTLGNVELPEFIRKLREQDKVDLILVLSHLGYPQELKLTEEVSGIDVLLSGHTHNRLYQSVLSNGALVMQSGSHGSFVGRLDLEVGQGKIRDFKHRLINIDETINPDPETESLVNQVMQPHREMLNTPVGSTRIALNRSRVLETTMDNLLLQTIIEAGGTELAFSYGWRYGAPVVPGIITMNDLWNIIPPNPPILTCEISGSEIWEMLEDDLERVFSRDPYEQMGGYVKRCLGLNLYFKIENPQGKRIQELYINNQSIDREKTYTASFVTTQGIPERFGRNRRTLDVKAIEALKAYLARHSPASTELKGAVVPI